jgi:aminoglycoside 6'-N-acetyltransferase
MITLRRAVPDDREMLERWDADPDVRASDPHDWWQWEKELASSSSWSEMLIAELDGRPIGFLQIIDAAREETHYWGDVAENLRAIDIWIGEPGDRNRGNGTEMMHLALERCFADPDVTGVLKRARSVLSYTARAHVAGQRTSNIGKLSACTRS